MKDCIIRQIARLNELTLRIGPDPYIFRELAPLPSGHIPIVRRRWLFVGVRLGKRCRFEVELLSRHTSAPLTYSCRAVCAHNVLYQPECVRLAELEPLD